MSLPSTSQTVNMLHNLLLLVGGILVSRGVLTSDELNIAVGAVTTLLTVVLNVVSHQQALNATPVKVVDTHEVTNVSASGSR